MNRSRFSDQNYKDLKNLPKILPKQKPRDMVPKQLQEKLQSLKSQLRKITDNKKDEGLQWSELGFDVMLIDEAHRYKNLMITSSNSNIANMPASKRAQDLLLKVRHLEESQTGWKRCHLCYRHTYHQQSPGSLYHATILANG